MSIGFGLDTDRIWHPGEEIEPRAWILQGWNFIQLERNDVDIFVLAGKLLS